MFIQNVKCLDSLNFKILTLVDRSVSHLADCMHARTSTLMSFGFMREVDANTTGIASSRTTEASRVEGIKSGWTTLSLILFLATCSYSMTR